MNQSDAASERRATVGTTEASAPRAAGDPAANPALARLQSQLDWYDRYANRSQRWFTAFKVVSIVVAAAIPILSGFGEPLLGSADRIPLVVGLLGAVIVVAEGLLRLFQWEHHWLRYRATWQALDREKALYLGMAGPYGDAQNPRKLLAERVEDLITQENITWASLHEERRGRDSASGTGERP